MSAGKLESSAWQLFRARPDPSAPEAPSPLTYNFISWTTYLIYLCILPICLPYLYLLHHFTPRPFDSWTLERRITTRLAKLQVNLAGYWLPSTPWDEWGISPPGEWYVNASEKGEMDVQAVRLEPVDEKYIGGIASAGPGIVKRVVRPGFWITPEGCERKGAQAAAKGERVILHIHGGGYIRGHPLWTPFAGDIAKVTGYRCLSANYRKTLSLSTAFPAPLLDVLSAYLYLTQTLHFDPANVVLLGESAGAHLGLVLSQYLQDNSLQQPGFIALSSPWADFRLSHPSYIDNAAYDQLSRFRLGRAVKSAMRLYTSQAKDHPYFSPARAASGNWNYLEEEGTKVYIHYGGKELFRDEIVGLGSAMKDAGVDIRIREDPEGLHTSGMIAETEAGRTFRKDLLEMVG